jgi:hypothetical protein
MALSLLLLHYVINYYQQMINHNLLIALKSVVVIVVVVGHDCLSNNYIIMLNSSNATLINHSISLWFYCSIHFISSFDLNFLCRVWFLLLSALRFSFFHYSIIFIMQVKYTVRRTKANYAIEMMKLLEVIKSTLSLTKRNNEIHEV